MSISLTDELAVELERTGDEPLRVENPRNQRVYVIIPEEKFVYEAANTATGDAHDAWTKEKNRRRFALIDKEIAGTLMAFEATELDRLQDEVDAYLRHVAPLPLAASRMLHEQLRQSLADSPRS